MRSGLPKTVSLGGSLRVRGLPPGAEDASRERLRHAVVHGEAAVEEGRRRLGDPFDLLKARQKLDVTSRGRNDILWAAGERFRRHWHGARLDALTSLDVSRAVVDGGVGPGAGPSEAALRHREAHRRACLAVGERLLPVLTGMVIRSEPALALRHLVDETAHARTAEAIVVERLREALHRLVDHWGLAPPVPLRGREQREARGAPPHNPT